VIRYF